jgi:hypothetical protein
MTPSVDGRIAGRLRVGVLALLFLLLVATGVSSQDRLLRAVAYTEALSPIPVLLIQGVDDPLEAGLLGGTFLLNTVPNAVLLLAEADANAPVTRAARLVSAGVGLATAAASLGFGTAVLFGALPELGLQPYAGSILAISVPALLAGLLDFLPYSIEAPPPPTAAATR